MPRKKRASSPFELMDDDFDDTSSQSSRNGNPPMRNAANARERARMRVLSSAFGRLKTKLPNIPADTKLSKLDTLRLATMYIKQLKTVVEGGPASPNTSDDTIDASLSNSPSNCYLNLHSGAQSMNWPFGFHHHLANTATAARSTASSSPLVNNSAIWCQTDNGHLKHTRYENENYHQMEQTQQQQQHPSFMQHTTTTQQNSQNQDNHWYSETPSPELDTSPSACLGFENSHLHQNQPQNQNHLSHLQPALTHSSAYHHLPHHHHFQHHQHQHQQAQHLQHGFVNTSNFQSTSIR